MSVSDDGLVSSLRYLFADFLEEEDRSRPSLPDGLPEDAVPIVSEAIHLLMDYQGASYARLYVDQLKLAEFVDSNGRVQSRNVEKFRFDELVDALPAVVAEPVLMVLDKLGWTRQRVSIPFSTASKWGIWRLKVEAWLRRWRMFSIRYGQERAWVERWLHMINRSLVKQPQAVGAIIETATMVQGFGDPYRQGLADWHAIIDGLAKPTFDGVLPLSDLAGAIAEARAAAMPDPRQAALKRAIAEIRGRAAGADAAAG